MPRMSQFQHRNLPHLLLHARETLMAYFRPILNRAGVTEQQWRVLRTLSEREPLEPNQIAAQCQILRPSLTRMLLGMEQAGLIERARSSADQRRQDIRLTPKARTLIEQLRPKVDQCYEQLEASVGKDRLEQLYRDIDAAIAQIKRSPPA